MKKQFVTILYAIIGFGIISAFYLMGRNNGYQHGELQGINDCLDTVIVLLENQVKSDTSVTKLHIINPDTHVYYISRQTIIEK